MTFQEEDEVDIDEKLFSLAQQIQSAILSFTSH